MEGVVHVRLDDHADGRGSFREIFRAGGWPVPFVQANHSHSKAGVVRGLHYHRRQSDLWYVVGGDLVAACVDLRRRTDRPISWMTVMSGERPTALYIPPGVAHGFFARTDVDLVYWVSHEYDATDEYGVAWNDPALGLDWGVEAPILSERDAENERLDWSRIPPFS